MNVASAETPDQSVQVDMAQDKPAPDARPQPKPGSQGAKPDTQPDLERMRAYLGQGLAGFARQGDIVELHKRMGEKFAALPEELADHVSRQNAPIMERLEELETALNRLEGALRIELPPMLSDVIATSVQDQAPRRRKGLRLLGAIVLLALGVASGVIFQAELSAYADQLQVYIRNLIQIGS